MLELDLLKNALSLQNDFEALGRLRAYAPQIRAALEEHDFVLDDDLSTALVRNPDWLAQVYEALAGTDESTLPLDQEQNAISAILANEQESIADAWAALLDKLDAMAAPGAMGRWEQSLQPCLTKDRQLLSYLRGQPSVRDGEPAAERLLQYGLTPAMLFQALHLMELLFDRVLRRASGEPAQLKRDKQYVLIQDGKITARIGASMLGRQIAGTLDLQEGMAAPLARSLSCMLQSSPLLVDGYCQVNANSFVKLPESARHRRFLAAEPLMLRWCASDRELPISM